MYWQADIEQKIEEILYKLIYIRALRERFTTSRRRDEAVFLCPVCGSLRPFSGEFTAGHPSSAMTVMICNSCLELYEQKLMTQISFEYKSRL